MAEGFINMHAVLRWMDAKAVTSDNSDYENIAKGTENIFHIVNGLVQNVDRTKKLVLAMVVAIVISKPVSFHITNVLSDPPFPLAWLESSFLSYLSWHS